MKIEIIKADVPTTGQVDNAGNISDYTFLCVYAIIDDGQD